MMANTHEAVGGIEVTVLAAVTPSWLTPAFYHEADGAVFMSAFYVDTHLASGAVSLEGTASIHVTYAYLAYSTMSIGGEAHAKLVTPARTRYRAVLDESRHTAGGVPGYCLVYPTSMAVAGEHSRKSAAWVPKRLLLGKTIVQRRSVTDRKSIDENTVIVETC